MKTSHLKTPLALTLLATLASPASYALTECKPFEKQVSIDGGSTWNDADDIASAPQHISGGDVEYRFVLNNCDPFKFCRNTRVEDATLGIPATQVGNGEIPPLTEVIVTHSTKGFEKLSQPKSCVPGTLENTATERTFTDGVPTEEVFSDSAFVKCGEPPKARLGDRVWEDENGNGKQDDNEPGIPGVPVDLYSPGDDGICNGDSTEILVNNTSTNGDGFYLFEGLDGGDYCVVFPDPEVALSCPVDQQASYTIKQAGGTTSDDDSNANPDGSTDVVGLPTGGEDLSIDAGLFCSVSLGDTLWNDSNRDGIQDNLNQNGGEQGINGVQVMLLDCDSEPVGSSTLTGPAPAGVAAPQVEGGAGWYEFGGLVPGCYSVMFDKPAGFEFSPSDQAGDDLDSDVNVNGKSGQITLNSGESNPTIDAGVNKPVSGLGDFVFEDLNADGIQDDDEPGIPNVTVTLFTPGDDGECNTDDDVSTGMSDITDAMGAYAFNGLDEGRYCVSFDKSGINCTSGDFLLGDAQFSPALQGDVGKDSNADPATGVSGNIDLPADTFDPTIDAGIYCPAKLGNRVWEDTDGNGLQDDGEPGVEGVMVQLVECGPDMEAGTEDDVVTDQKRTTDELDGMYMFGGEFNYSLEPGKYFVQFMDPQGRILTQPGVGPDNRDSDCRAPDGNTTCVALNSGEVNLNQDCGLLPPPQANCDLTIDKRCRVETPPAPSFEGSCKGKIQELTMIWNGPDGVNLAGVAPLTVSQSTVNNGDTVTLFSNDSGSNDVFVDLSGNVNGRSVFHLSCSDDDMDADTDTDDVQSQVSPAGQDCGKNQGDGKSNDGEFVNSWLLDGMVDAEGKVLQCSPQVADGFEQNCAFEKSSVSCETHGKPERLTLRYLGNGPVSDCLDNAASRADQKPPICSGNVPAGATVDITLNDGDASKTTVAPGETFDITGYSSQTELLLTGGGGEEFVSFHTSCSAPLETGDIFGNLELVGLDGQRSTATVTYEYAVTNNGDALTDVKVTDDKLGDIGSVASLASGVTERFNATTEISETTTNVGSASGKLNGESCAVMTPDEVIVTAVAPTCRATLELKEIKDDEIKFYVNNTGAITATIESLTLDFPAGFEAIKEVKFEGDMFKEGDSDNYADGVPSGTTLTESDWTEENVSKRQVEADDREELKFKFTDKQKDVSISDFELNVKFAEGCELQLEQ